MSHAAPLLTKMMNHQHFWLLGAKPVAALAAHAGRYRRYSESPAPGFSGIRIQSNIKALE
jgi:hypothetical protein